MARLPSVSRDDLDPEDQAVYDRVASSRGSVRGPFSVLIHNPPVADRVAELGSQLRFRSTLNGADRELAILAAGREVEAPYEWYGHEALALEEGTRAEAIEVLRRRGSTDELTPHEALIVDVVRALYREHRVPADLYARAEAEFGRKTLVELVVLAGYYGLMGFTLNAFEADLPPGVKQPF